MTKPINIRPYKDRLLIFQKEMPKESTGGIILPPSSAGKKVNEGVVISKGHDVSDNIAEGDYVIFGEYDGEPLKFGGEEYHLIIEEDIRAVLEQEDGN
jgi:chaperonin GroES|uniref:Co-chaperonin GroES n=1 Tax=uncultured virus TaxID=340016 RepID=A0A221S2E6_9VIRU|nr:co-chaperonin GroES [uncultured virus]